MTEITNIDAKDRVEVPQRIIELLVGMGLRTETGAALMAGFRMAHGIDENKLDIVISCTAHLVEQEENKQA